MPQEPHDVFDQGARTALLRRLLAERGVSLDDTRLPEGGTLVTPLVALVMHLGPIVAFTGSHALHDAGGDPTALRYCAAAFEMWTQTFDRLATYADEVIAEHGDEGIEQAAAFLREQSPPA